MLPEHLETLIWVVCRSLAVYTAILIGFRFAGKRHLSQLSLPDFALILLIANAVQNAMVGSDTSLVGGLVAAASLLVGNLILTRLLRRSPRSRDIFVGEPKLLVRNSQPIASALDSENLTVEDVEEAIREHGFASLEEVRTAILENDGSISIIPYPEPGKHVEHHLPPISRKRRGRKRLL
jgi:uncharacterized membrane protein YcaP (DUF421 family)